MSDRLWIGVDLGLEGAIAFVHGDQVDVVDMPVVTFNRHGATRRRLSHREIVDVLNRGMEFGQPAFALFEAVHARPAKPASFGKPGRDGGTKGAFSLGHSDGTFRGVFTALDIPFRTVSPQAWKKHYGLAGNDKRESVAEAQRRFPTLQLRGPRGGYLHGRAEAALLAAFGRHLETRGELGEPESP